MSLTQGDARSSRALGYFHIVPAGLQFGSLRSRNRRTSKLTDRRPSEASEMAADALGGGSVERLVCA